MVQLDQRPKLGLLVRDEELVVLELDLGVDSGHRDVGHPDLALMATA